MTEKLNMKSIAILALAFCSMAGVQAFAQAVAEANTADEVPDQPIVSPGGLVCLAGPIKGGDAKGKSLIVRVPAERAHGLKSRGFAPTDCLGVTRGTVGRRRKFCEAAMVGSPSLDMAYWQALGLTPGELCRSVDALHTR